MLQYLSHNNEIAAWHRIIYGIQTEKAFIFIFVIFFDFQYDILNYI